MEHYINIKASFAKIGITDPSRELLDTAVAEAERLFVVKPALVAAFNIINGAGEKRRAYNRKNVSQPETNHES